MTNRSAFLFLLVTLCQPVVADFTFQFNGHTYQVKTAPLNWASAQSAASNSTFNGAQGYLAVISSEAENTAIYEQLESNIKASSFNLTSASDGGGSAYVWIGANDIATEGIWVWDATKVQFWSGNQAGSAVGSSYSNWGTGGGRQNEPDNTNQQDAAALALQTWPNPSLNAGFVLGTAGQWNDVDVSNTLYYIIEYETTSDSQPKPEPDIAINSYRYADNFSVLSAVPRGCLSELPRELPVPTRPGVFRFTSSQNVNKPNAAGTESVSVAISAWRYGCHEPNRSAVMINFSLPEGASDDLLTQIEMRPSIIFIDDEGEIPLVSYHWDHGTEGSSSIGTGTRGYLSDSFPNGVTYVLDTPAFGVATSADLDGFIRRYNAGGKLRIIWNQKTVTFGLPAYNPSIDQPQHVKPSFTGRTTGQWVADGLPATGLLLQVGEVPRQDRNYLFAIWFTYLDGQPIWIASNKDIPLGTNEVILDMAYFDGGKLFNHPGDFTGADIGSDILGTMKVRILDCNSIEVVTDFSASGLGQSTLAMNRLIRIAGYDCDGTQSVQ